MKKTYDFCIGGPPKTNKYFGIRKFSRRVLEIYKTIILRDLRRMRILGKFFKNMSVLEVGSGRQAVIFEELGFNKVVNVNNSIQTIKDFKKYIIKKGSSIEANLLDICSDKFNRYKYKFNLIYLHGIIQHVKKPEVAIRNCVKNLKKNGIIWLYFYQLGSSKYFYTELGRLIVRKYDIPIEKFKKRFSYLNNDFLDGIVDDFYCDHMFLNTFSYYDHQMKKNKMKLIFSKDISPSRRGSIRFSNQSVLTAYKKTSNVKLFYQNKKEEIKSIFDKENFVYEDQETVEYIKSVYFSIKKQKKKINKEDTYKILKFIIKNYSTDNFYMSYKSKINKITQTYDFALRRVI